MGLSASRTIALLFTEQKLCAQLMIQVYGLFSAMNNLKMWIEQGGDGVNLETASLSN